MNYYKPGDSIKFNLMIRNKANIIVKNKSMKGNNFIPTSTFPWTNEAEYKHNKILLVENENSKI